MCCRLETFCCCCSLRTGAILVAIYSLLCAALGIGPGVYLYMQDKDSVKSAIEKYPDLETKAELTEAFYNESLHEELEKSPNTTINTTELYILAERDAEAYYVFHRELVEPLLQYASYVCFGFGGIALFIAICLIIAICTETACCIVPWVIGAVIDILLLAALIVLFALIKYWYIFSLLFPLFWKIYICMVMCSYFSELQDGGSYRITRK